MSSKSEQDCRRYTKRVYKYEHCWDIASQNFRYISEPSKVKVSYQLLWAIQMFVMCEIHRNFKSLFVNIAGSRKQYVYIFFAQKTTTKVYMLLKNIIIYYINQTYVISHLISTLYVFATIHYLEYLDIYNRIFDWVT